MMSTKKVTTVVFITLMFVAALFILFNPHGCKGSDYGKKGETGWLTYRNLEFKPFDGALPSIPDEEPAWKSKLFPQYLVYWEPDATAGGSDYRSGRLMLDFQLMHPKKMYNHAESRFLPEATLYCQVEHPDGELVRLVAEIPERSPVNLISFPITKQIPWRPYDPEFIKFRFIYESKSGVGAFDTTYGFNRIHSQNGYFRLEGESIYIRGAYDYNGGKLLESDPETFLGELKNSGFNLYLSNIPPPLDALEAASRTGMLMAWFGDPDKKSNPLFGIALRGGESARFYQSPSWLGTGIIDTGITGTGSPARVIRFYDLKKRIAGAAGLEPIQSNPSWLGFTLPPCPPDFDELIEALNSGNPIPGLPLIQETTAPICLTIPGLGKDDCPRPDVELYDLINLARRQEWCAGFIIPLELYDPGKHQGLMTDDFIIFDLDGFPLEKQVKAFRGSTLDIPIRYANFKHKGDNGGVLFWTWEETGDEGRVEYGALPRKGIIEMDPLVIPVPGKPGIYRLRIEAIGSDGFHQAVNRLDVTVE